MIQFEEDTIVIPKESSWFGFFPENYEGPVQLPWMVKFHKPTVELDEGSSFSRSDQFFCRLNSTLRTGLD